MSRSRGVHRHRRRRRRIIQGWRRRRRRRYRGHGSGSGERSHRQMRRGSVIDTVISAEGLRSDRRKKRRRRRISEGGGRGRWRREVSGGRGRRRCRSLLSEVLSNPGRRGARRDHTHQRANIERQDSDNNDRHAERKQRFSRTYSERFRVSFFVEHRSRANDEEKRGCEEEEQQAVHHA